MNWYYATQGEQRGPIEAAELRALVAAGTVGRGELAWRSGMPEWQPIAKIEELEVAAPFFAVSLLKLAVMSTISFGMYDVFWFYEQWAAVKRRTGEDMWLWARAIFSVFFVSSLGREIAGDSETAGVPVSIRPTQIAILYFILCFAWRLPEPLYLIGFLNVVPLMLLQRQINLLHATVAPGLPRNARFTWLNWIGIAIGSLFLVALVAGLFL